MTQMWRKLCRKLSKTEKINFSIRIELQTKDFNGRVLHAPVFVNDEDEMSTKP